LHRSGQLSGGGGWSLNGTAIISSGFPLFVFQQNLNSAIGALNQRPNATGISHE